jgi:hypothetical protein
MERRGLSRLVFGLHISPGGKSGKILFGFNSGGSVIDGPSLVDGTVYWGSGHRGILWE